MRFLIDMPITPRAVELLVSAGHEAVHAVDVGLARATDQQILEAALAQGRIVVTADLDYPRLLAIHGAPGPGLILFRGGSLSDVEMLRLLRRVLDHETELDLEHSIVSVDARQIRRRRLPIET